MCEFEYELEQIIMGFVDNDSPFTSMLVRNGIRDGFNMPIRYKEANHETLTHMQHNAAEYKYAARSIEIVTGQDVLGQDEHASVWEFVPIKTIVDDFNTADANADVGEVVVTAKKGGGFFARIFARSD